MKKMKKNRRWLVMLLAAAIIFCSVPSALAEDSPSAAAGNTIETADTSASIALNLFNYNDAAVNSYSDTTGTTPFQFNGGGLDNNYVGMNTYSGQLGSTYDTYAIQGIVQSKLNAKGYPATQSYTSPLVYSAFNLDYLFDSSVGASTDTSKNVKTSYEGLNHLFTYNAATKTYSYDSATNYAYYDTSDTSNKDFTVSNAAYSNSTQNVNKVGGFFPFDSYTTGSTTYHFGLTMVSTFQMPTDHKVAGENMTFSFSGDDDMWVYIDGVLVLDLGGIHGAASGEINFTDGTVTLTNDPLQVGSISTDLHPDSNIVNGKTAKISDLYKKAGLTYDNSTGSTHTIKVFYLERGESKSNCSMSFNLPVLNAFNVEKSWSDGNENHVGDSVDVNIFRKKGAEGTNEFVKKVTLDNSNNWTLPVTVETYVDGTTGEEMQYLYSVSEDAVEGYNTTYSDNNAAGVTDGTVEITNTKIQNTDLKLNLVKKNELRRSWAVLNSRCMTMRNVRVIRSRQ